MILGPVVEVPPTEIPFLRISKWSSEAVYLFSQKTKNFIFVFKFCFFFEVFDEKIGMEMILGQVVEVPPTEIPFLRISK